MFSSKGRDRGADMDEEVELVIKVGVGEGEKRDSSELGTSCPQLAEG